MLPEDHCGQGHFAFLRYSQNSPVCLWFLHQSRNRIVALQRGGVVIPIAPNSATEKLWREVVTPAASIDFQTRAVLGYGIWRAAGAIGNTIFT